MLVQDMHTRTYICVFLNVYLLVLPVQASECIWVYVCMCRGTCTHVHHLSAGEGLHVCAGEWGVTVCGTCCLCEFRYVQVFE